MRELSQNSKPPKKKAKQPSNILKSFYYCKEVVSPIDIKAKNVLVKKEKAMTLFRHNVLPACPTAGK